MKILKQLAVLTVAFMVGSPSVARANPLFVAAAAAGVAAAKKNGRLPHLRCRESPHQSLSTVRSFIRSRKDQVRQVVQQNGGPVTIFRNRDVKLLVTESGRLAYQKNRPGSGLRRIFFGFQVSRRKFYGLHKKEVNDTFLTKFVYEPQARARWGSGRTR